MPRLYINQQQPAVAYKNEVPVSHEIKPNCSIHIELSILWPVLRWKTDFDNVRQAFRCHRRWSGRKAKHPMVKARKRYPLYQYGDEYTALVDPQAGVILANKWLAAFHDEFLKAGGTVSEQTLVKAFHEDDDSVLLNTCKGEFRAPKVVFALGSWISKLLPELPVKGQTQILSVCYWAPKDPADLPLIKPDKYPVHLVYQPDGRCFFSMGSVDVEGAVKFMLHGGQNHHDTDVPAGDIHEKFVEDVRAHIAKNVPFLDTINGPVKVERCKYTMSPDEHYVIDYLPGSKNIQVAGCMSGAGFKNSPGVGRAVAQRAMGEAPFTDLSFFSLDRFKKRESHL